MVYISKDGDVVCTDRSLDSVVELYEAWKQGLAGITLTTSGSTGTPKPITLMREAVQASVELTSRAFHLHEGYFFLCNLNTNYIGGKMMVIRAAETGCDLLAVAPSAHPFEALGKQTALLYSNRGKNFFSFVPLQLQRLLGEPEAIELLRTAGVILVGGAAVPESTRQAVRQWNLPVYETYGMTETVSHIALKDLRTEDLHFTALEGVTLDTDEHSCLKIKAPSTLQQWITTHDVVELLTPSQFILKGRRDNIINSGGVKIQAEEVERAVALAFPFLGNFFCYGLPDSTLGQKLVLVVEGDGPSPDLSVLPLPRYHIPKDIIRIQEFARTPSGKTDKAKTVVS